MIFAIDFDRTIMNPYDVLPGYKMGRPYKGAKEYITRLFEEGHEIVIHTRRGESEQSAKVVENWMEYFEIPFTYITNMKPDADYFIDDKAVRFRGDWEKIREFIGG